MLKITLSLNVSFVHDAIVIVRIESIKENIFLGFQQFLHLKTKNPEVKLLISIGGWMKNANIYEEVVFTNHFYG